MKEGNIVDDICPQCSFGELVCSPCMGAGPLEKVAGPDRIPVSNCSEFRTCPRCGYSEEAGGSQIRRWKGYGVYVLQAAPGMVRAGAFPCAIPDHKVQRLVARFEEMGSNVRYVTRWNERNNQLEVLCGKVG